MQPRRSKIAFALLILAAVVFLPAVALAQHYQQTNLVSDIPGLALHTDADLVNAWGIIRGPTTPWWVNDNGTGKATLYNASGVKQALIVTEPPPTGSPAGTTSTPTGIAFNGNATAFMVSNSLGSGPARFIFATEDGTISGWTPAAGTTAVLEVDRSGSAIYKGLTIAQFNGASYLYAANFQSGKVDVFDSSWAPATLRVDQFVDPLLPPGYAPFNVQNINGDIIVNFAKVGVLPDEEHGRGLGFVDRFSSDGTLLMRFQHGPWLNAPWGVALAPTNFGEFSNRLLIGQFGSGQIAAYDTATGEFEGRLHGLQGVLVIDGLWGLGFGGGAPNNGPVDTLFFTAGPNDEQNGLFGTLTAIPEDDD